MRQYFFDVWRKANATDLPRLEPLEKLVASIIEQHPEYQPMLTKPEAMLEQEFLPESGHSNPFLHMSMHIAIQEQLGTGRPPGINDIWGKLVRQHNNPHDAEHLMMECLAEMLWQSQSTGQEPDQSAYLQQLLKLTQK
jgi:hypothetical protein